MVEPKARDQGALRHGFPVEMGAENNTDIGEQGQRQPAQERHIAIIGDEDDCEQADGRCNQRIPVPVPG